MGKRFGIAYVKVNGSLLESMPGASIDVGGVTRTPVLGGNQVLGFTESPAPAMVQCEISLGPGVSLVDLGKIADAVVTFECDTGQVYTVRGAAVQDPPKATAAGTVPLKFFGQPADEQGV